MDKNFLLILFYSASGAVKNLAHAIADGAEDEGIIVKLRTVPKISSNTEKIETNSSNIAYVILQTDESFSFKISGI